jgi:hypothetical protein
VKGWVVGCGKSKSGQRWAMCVQSVDAVWIDTDVARSFDMHSHTHTLTQHIDMHLFKLDRHESAGAYPSCIDQHHCSLH